MSEPIRGGMLELHESMYDDRPWHVGKYLLRELRARGWTLTDLAEAMPGDFGKNLCTLEFACVLDDPGVRLGRETAERVASALGQNASTWLGLDLFSRHCMSIGRWKILTADCACRACSQEPPEDRYVNGRLKGSE